MPAQVPLSRRVATASRWPFGVALTSWRYMWRTVPMHRSEEEGSWADDGPPELPDDVPLDDALHPPAGAGPLFRRRYPGTARWYEQLTEATGGDPAAVAMAICARTGRTTLREAGVGLEALDRCADAAAERQELQLTPPRADRAELRTLYANAC